MRRLDGTTVRLTNIFLEEDADLSRSASRVNQPYPGRSLDRAPRVTARLFQGRVRPGFAGSSSSGRASHTFTVPSVLA
jgi:hypothetical protein